MSSTKIKILGKEYEVACDNGQEEHLLHLAAEVEKRARAISGNIKRASAESTTLILALITFADEVYDLKQELNSIKSSKASSKNKSKKPNIDENILAGEINTASNQIEDLLSRLEVA